VQRDLALRFEIARMFAESFAMYVYVAFVIDIYARRIVDRRGRRTAHASFVLDTLKPMLYDGRSAHRDGSFIRSSESRPFWLRYLSEWLGGSPYRSLIALPPEHIVRPPDAVWACRGADGAGRLAHDCRMAQNGDDG
jgi:hypothetical protein